MGLAVNLLCAFILDDAHEHGHEHDGTQRHARGHHHGHQHDLNPRSAYIHVVADAATSVLAIGALLGAGFSGGPGSTG